MTKCVSYFIESLTHSVLTFVNDGCKWLTHSLFSSYNEVNYAINRLVNTVYNVIYRSQIIYKVNLVIK